MSVSKTLKESEFKVSRYIDLDKDKTHIYTNIYLDNFQIAVKLPISINNPEKFGAQEEIRIEEFDLTEYIYLFDY